MAKRHSFLRVLRRLAVSMLTLLLVLGALPLTAPATVTAATEEDSSVSRLINVVYDDSSSMLINQSTAWSEAKYSLMILSAMMQENDIMNVYFMSDFYSDNHQNYKTDADPRLSNLSGADINKLNNINKIHNEESFTYGTPLCSVEKAYEDLKNDSGNYDERHLIVLTDGATFSTVTNNIATASDMDAIFSDAATDGIKVTYLAIGGDTLCPKENTDNVKVFTATPNTKPDANDSILKRVQEISKHIFQRHEDPDGFSNNKLTLPFPVSEIVVFAQGENVAVNADIKDTIKVEVSASMTAEDANSATTNSDYNPADIRVADGLGGLVAIFKPTANGYIPEGDYDLDIQATTYAVYYKPALDVVLNLTDEDNLPVESGTEIDMGTYQADYYLTYPQGHPQHGQAISKNDLGFDVEYTLAVTTGGKTGTTDGPGPQTIELGEGQAVVRVTARYLNYISSAATANFIVKDLEVYKLSVTIDPQKREYVLSEMEGTQDGYTVKVSHEDGTALTADEWSTCELTLTSEGVDFFEPVKNADHTFTVRPKRKNDSYEATGSGEVPFTAVATLKDDKRITHKSGVEGIVDIYNDVIPDEEQGGFRVTVLEIVPEDIPSTDFNKLAPVARVQITWNGNPLTQAQYDALELTAKMKKDYMVKDGKKEVPLLVVSGVELDPYVEGEPTTATVSFLAQGDEVTQRKKLAAKDDFIVNAVIEREGVKSEASTEDELGVKRVWTAAEILWIIFWILLVLFVLFGYVICKKYLPVRIKYANNGGESRTIKPYTKLPTLLSILIPFRGVTATLRVSYYTGNAFTGMTSSDASLKIRACSKNTAVLTNAQDLYKSSTVFLAGTKPALDAMAAPAPTKGKKKKRKKREFKIKLISSQLYEGGSAVATFAHPPKNRKGRKR